MRRRLYLRRAIGVVIGLALAIALIDAGWHLANRWFPPMLDLSAVIDDAPSILTMPLGGMAIIALGWFLAGLIGAFVALRIAQWRPAGWIVACIVVATNGWTAATVVEPVWLIATSLIAPLLGGWLAERHFRRARPGDPLLN